MFFPPQLAIIRFALASLRARRASIWCRSSALKSPRRCFSKLLRNRATSSRSIGGLGIERIMLYNIFDKITIFLRKYQIKNEFFSWLCLHNSPIGLEVRSKNRMHTPLWAVRLAKTVKCWAKGEISRADPTISARMELYL